jgi:hypothetical protein
MDAETNAITMLEPTRSRLVAFVHMNTFITVLPLPVGGASTPESRPDGFGKEARKN